MWPSMSDEMQENWEPTYKVNEIFDSIEGEGKRAGELATFIRLSGCNLRCSYCDTAYAFSEGTKMTIPEIVSKVHYHNVTLTGGEPLCQNIGYLLDALQSHIVNIETNGSIPVQAFHDYSNVFFTIDYKCKSSGMTDKMYLRNFSKLRKRDVLKFVVGSREDLEEAVYIYHRQHVERTDCKVYVSPVFGKIEPAEIVEFLKRNDLQKWRVQLQLHKFIWAPEKRGV